MKTLSLLLASLLCLNAWGGEWTLKDRDGVRHTQSGMHGKWTLVNFWAPWCPTCLQELPDFVAVQKAHHDLQVIGVAVMYKSRKEVNEVASQLSVSYPVVYGSEDIASNFGGMEGLPTTYLYNPSGKLVGRHAGPLTEEQLEQALSGKAPQLFTN